MIPCGWYPKIYFRVGGSSWLRCKRIGKYEAKSSQKGSDLTNFERRDRVPEDGARENWRYTRYDNRMGQARGMVQSRKKAVRKSGMESVCMRTQRV